MSDNSTVSDLRKEKIISALKQARQEGTSRTENIREIIKSAVTQAVTEVKEGSTEIRSLAKDAIAAVIEVFQEKGGEIQEEITASIEGVIEGVSQAKRQSISTTQTEVKQLETKLDTEEKELQEHIDKLLVEVKETGNNQSDTIKASIESAINSVRDREELTLLQNRYAQLKAQLAIVQANLASRYGERFEEAKQYLDEAKVWYEKAKQDPEVFTDKVGQKRAEFEQQLSITGVSIAKKEREAKQLLRELWKSLSDVFHNA